MPAKKKAVTTKAKSKKRSMSTEHKAALAKGREQGRAVRAYLEALESNRPRPGRKRTPASIQKRLQAVDVELRTADPLKRVQLFQERMDLRDALDSGTAAADLPALERAFIKNVKAYSESKGITYTAWREAGVPSQVLTKAGVARTRRA